LKPSQGTLQRTNLFLLVAIASIGKDGITISTWLRRLESAHIQMELNYPVGAMIRPAISSRRYKSDGFL